MDYSAMYKQWLTDEFFDEETRRRLAAPVDEKEIEDRFYRDLDFGTGGLRGVMGEGTNRMNKYTVGKATAGLGKYLLGAYGQEARHARGVAIGYDTWNSSEYFACIAADVLSGMGIRVYLHAHASPTPQLSFSVKFWNALAGVVVTASHNPKEYNGYKVFDEFGCQLVPWQAKQVIRYVDATDYHSINSTRNRSLISVDDITDDFVNAALRQSRYKDQRAKENLKIVYTPLHGTGNIPVQKALHRDGFEQVDAIEEQVAPDGNFPTVVSPNLEARCALEMGIAKAKRTDADIVLGTAPDSDRVGLAVRTSDGNLCLMTGNKVGVLLMNFILTHTDMSKYPLLQWSRRSLLRT